MSEETARKSKTSCCNTTVGERAEYWSQTDPDTPAFVFVAPDWSRRVLTRGDVYRLGSKFAGRLRKLGVGRGHYVVNALVNSPERVVTHLGIILSGAVSINRQVSLKDSDDFIHSLKAASCVAAIVDPRQRNGAADILNTRESTLDEKGWTVYPELPRLQHVLHVPLTPDPDDPESSWLEKLDSEDDMFHDRDVTPDDAAVVWVTSGSTGFAKMALRTHRQVLHVAEAITNAFGLQPPDSIYNPSSLGWISGALHYYLTMGVTRVMPDLTRQTPPDPFTFAWEIIQREKCAGTFLPPFFIEKLLQVYRSRASDGDRVTRSGSAKSWKLKVLNSGGQPLKKVHMAAVGTITEELKAGYASTETGLVSLGSVTSNPETFTSGWNGTARSGVELRVVGEDGNEVAPGELGEFLVRGPQSFTRYINDETATQRTVRPKGWIATGDVGVMTTEGEVVVYCRKSFSIMRGSHLIYPGWLGSRLEGHPDLLAVLVVPVPDPVLHQELCACVVTQPGVKVTEEELRQWSEELFLENAGGMSAVPRYFLFFDTLPVNSNGKVCRRTAAAMAKQRLGLADAD